MPRPLPHLPRPRRVGLVAHDHCKPALLDWAEANLGSLLPHRLVCTGTTGRLLRERLQARLAGERSPRTATLQIEALRSGPLGGDQQFGARIAQGEIDLLVFLWDPMQPQPHDVDVKALLRIAVLYDVPLACSIRTANALLAAGLLD